MKTLLEYINETIRHLPRNVSGVIVFDIDDTLLKVDSSIIAIYKKEPGKPEIALTTEEFANDPDASDPNKKDWFDLRDFSDPIKVYNSIISGTPLLKNLKIMDAYINAGYDFCFLTARSCEETIKQALDEFLMINRHGNKLEKLGNAFKKTISCAVNDEYKQYPGKTDADKKANILRQLCQYYDKVVFVDDDHKNVRAAINLKIDNLKVIKAWDE